MVCLPAYLRAVSCAEDVIEGLTQHAYLPDEALATAAFKALRLRRPLLLEGEPGVGKTEVARVISDWGGGRLIRLQCYEGADSAQAASRVRDSGLRKPPGVAETIDWASALSLLGGATLDAASASAASGAGL